MKTQYITKLNKLTPSQYYPYLIDTNLQTFNTRIFINDGTDQGILVLFETTRPNQESAGGWPGVRI